MNIKIKAQETQNIVKEANFKLNVYSDATEEHRNDKWTPSLAKYSVQYVSLENTNVPKYFFYA